VGSAFVSGVSSGTVFYLQDVSYTGNVVFSANPNLISSPTAYGTTTLTFDVSNSVTPSSPNGVTATEIHIGSPTGPLFFRGGATATVTTGDWVTNGMQFFLQDTSNGNALSAANTLAIVPVAVTTVQGATNPTVFYANPNPVYSTTGLGSTTFTYNAGSGVSTIEIHVNSPTGPLLTQTGPSGTATADGWVTNGMKFYLQDTSNGEPGTTLGTVTVTLTTNASAAPPNLYNINPLTLGYSLATVTAQVR
jgi:hypothetical protein